MIHLFLYWFYSLVIFFLVGFHTCDKLLGSAGDDPRVTPGSDGVVLSKMTEDPQIVLPEVDCYGTRWGVLKAVVISPVSTIAQVYYKRTKQPVFSEFQSVKQMVHAGENTIYFQIPVNDMVESIRFDPGQAPGDYKIKSIAIRKIES